MGEGNIFDRMNENKGLINFYLKELSSEAMDEVFKIRNNMGVNDAHGWDVCYYADNGCSDAKDAYFFYNVCSKNGKCGNSIFRDLGGNLE